MVSRELADAFSISSVDAFLNEFSDHADETRMIARSAGADHSNCVFIAESSRFIVKIVKDLHVVRQESDWRNDHLLDSVGFCLPQMIKDVGFQPWILRTTAATLIDQFPAGFREIKLFSDQSARFAKLLLVV